MLQKISKEMVRLERERNKMLKLLASWGEEMQFSHGHGIAASPLQAKTLKELHVAAIMDRFTLECFRPECELTELTPEGWHEEMEASQPEFLFVESAWEGKEGLWHGKINHCTPEFMELVDYCREQGIPVVFWNKEDPVWTDVFMNAAKQADIVFTTELECVERYKTELEHDRVYHLHFGAQPLLHNPLEIEERKDKFCFAGAYYHRYQERCQVFDAFSEYFIGTKGLDIYDRNYPSPRPEHAFPEHYNPYILGRLEPNEIEKAYKGYFYGINMNSVTQKQTMFARRVFELMASNTIVVGNYSRGVKNYFGDLTICTDDAETLKKSLNVICENPEKRDKFRLLALRRVLQEHLCEDRLDFIVQKVFGCSLKPGLPWIYVFSEVNSQLEAERVMEMFSWQEYARKKLILISDKDIQADEAVIMLASKESLGEAVHDKRDNVYLAYFSPQDWYGKNYLLDLSLATRFGIYDVIGKGEYYQNVAGQIYLTASGQAYRLTDGMPLRRAIVRREVLPAEVGGDVLCQGDESVSIDAFNYCQDWQESSCPVAEDMEIQDQGISSRQINEAVMRVNGRLPSGYSVILNPAQIASSRPQSKTDKVSFELAGNKVLVDSQLPDNKHVYFMTEELIDVRPLQDKEGAFYIRFMGRANMNFICGCVFYDGAGNKISPLYAHLGRTEKMVPPQGATTLRVLFRVAGTGKGELERVVISQKIESSVLGGSFLSRSSVLLLTNHYPSMEHIYANMFVHRRVLAYKEEGCLIDVMRMHPGAAQGYREFEGVNVIEGYRETLEEILSYGNLKTVCVHFMNRDMWEVLKKHLDSIKLVIWSHGADIQPWHRRKFNYTTEDEIKKAKDESLLREQLWHEIFAAAEKAHIHFVFVSQHFAQEVMEDYKLSLPEECYSVIHNYIDSERFLYCPKTEEQRKHILTIKSFSTATYANDITAKAILELSSRECFKDLQFSIYGSGLLFEQINEPLREFGNVHLYNTFITPDEIVDLHREHGVYIATTRQDTQGVSRDEAMASGLVPIANAVSAIPEFVDDSCGMLVPGEDYVAVADAIERLYNQPELFLSLSENAAKRVRKQSGREQTIEREIKLIFG